MSAAKPLLIAFLTASALAGCSAEKTYDNTVDSALFVTKSAVKVTAGAAKLAVKGTGAAVRAVNGGDE
ncbi:hypothetical protein [Actibacterium ureilyticum]|uniref:hypothetical protein n=1 Tax=Actibacterium ureilyticum TaxID=1590614 RepID=UPI000BAB20CF|nr:hypothetical protein [Actibacterium ureilyticum]